MIVMMMMMMMMMIKKIMVMTKIMHTSPVPKNIGYHQRTASSNPLVGPFVSMLQDIHF